MSKNIKLNINEICFLCKKKAEVTEEHVFPQWLQEKYNIRNSFIVLKNGTKFRYNRLKIPCCGKCNNEILSQIENKISKLVKGINIAGLLENKDDTFIWLYKIMYGINYKEMFLKKNIKDKSSEEIISNDSIFERESYNMFLDFARGIVKFDGFSPYSLFVFELKDVPENTFHYVSEPYKMFVSIILGSVGIIASFQDDGYIQTDIEKITKISQYSKLTLPEFGDLSAFVLSLKCRMSMLPSYVCNVDSNKFVFKIQENSSDALFSDFDPEQHINIASTAYKFCFEKLLTKNEQGESFINYRSPFVYF